MRLTTNILLAPGLRISGSIPLPICLNGLNSDVFTFVVDLDGKDNLLLVGSTYMKKNYITILTLVFTVAQQPLVGQGLLFIEGS